MKKLLVLVCFLGFCATSTFAQTSAVFYGSDFSLVKVYGASESDGDFALAFNKINELFLTQSNKFDVAKYMRQSISKSAIKVAQEAMDRVFDATKYDEHNLLCGEVSYDCQPQIAQHIAQYQLAENEGRGIVIIANLLDKSHGKGSFYFVTFDIATRTIESCVLSSGKPKGFGLRNFWANSLYHAMKALPKNKR